jgi:ABC-type lipoprotein export system ATPase subunit
MNIPLVIYGESGCGKTAILAKITTQVKIFYSE